MERTCRVNERYRTYEYEAPKEIENVEMKNGIPVVVKFIFCGIAAAVAKL